MFARLIQHNLFPTSRPDQRHARCIWLLAGCSLILVMLIKILNPMIKIAFKGMQIAIHFILDTRPDSPIFFGQLLGEFT